MCTAKPHVLELLLLIVFFATHSLSVSAQEPNFSCDDLPASDEITASIVFLKGDVTLVRRSVVLSPLAKGTQVYSGDVIVTGENGFVSLKVSSTEDVVNVQPDSQITLRGDGSPNTADTGAVLLNLDDNCQVLSDVSSLNKTNSPTSFIVHFPYHSAAVRGPSFLIDDYLVPMEDVENNR